MNRVPLSFANQGVCVKIKDIIGGKDMCMKLKEMGFVDGMNIKVMRNDRGPIIVKVGESRIILGRGMANKVMVEVS